MTIPKSVKEFIKKALEEDIGRGDITSKLTIPKGHISTAAIIAKSNFVLAGMPFFREVFRASGGGFSMDVFFSDGEAVRKGMVIADISGETRLLLSCERVALNILQRLSGIATLTGSFVIKVKGTRVKILDTRKTTPGMRFMEKYAVRMGGGHNHRFGLYDGILIKDNHIRAAGGITKAILLAKKSGRKLEVEVETETLEDVKEAIDAKADIIMLDNMSLRDVKEAVKIVRGRAMLEVSGNVSLKNIRRIAETGVDFISIGALTHSAPSADISMKFIS